MAADQGVDLAFRSLGLYISMDGMYSADRAGHHELLMLVSRQMQSEKSEKVAKLKTMFANSFLWKRRRVSDAVQLLQRKDFINPLASIHRHDVRNLSYPQELRQHFTGVSMWNQIIKDLWTDISVTRSDLCIYVDLCPYDDSLAGAIINQKSENSSVGTSLPQAACMSIVWVADTPADKARIVKFLSQAIRTTIYKETMDKKYKLPALADEIFNQPKIESVPALVLGDYTVCLPQDDGSLPILQTCYDEWLAVPGVDAEFKEAVADHDKKFNPSGVPWKGQKRTEPAQCEVKDVDEEKLAQPLHAQIGDPTTKEAADQVYGSPHILPGNPTSVELLLYPGHGLFLYSGAAVVVGTQVPLGLLKGEFKLGNDALQADGSGPRPTRHLE